MRFWSALAAGVCCTLLGVFFAAQLSQRAAQLHTWHSVFQVLENALLHLPMPLPQLLRFAVQEDCPQLAAWADTLESHPACTLDEALPPSYGALTKEEWSNITRGLCALQSESLEVQRAVISQTCAVIKTHWQKAQDLKENRHKLYLQLGFLSGAALFILLF